ncbi:hypothetical protein EDC04DRAFT_2613600 [Pisolithus marmoratus]|nr:hypothetical protein EDC04DRAFT_2613600 [Pisolithus marmoratus]
MAMQTPYTMQGHRLLEHAMLEEPHGDHTHTLFERLGIIIGRTSREGGHEERGLRLIEPVADIVASRLCSVCMVSSMAYDESKKFPGSGNCTSSIMGIVGNPGEVIMVHLQGDFAKPPKKHFNYKHCFDALFRTIGAAIQLANALCMAM